LTRKYLRDVVTKDDDAANGELLARGDRAMRDRLVGRNAIERETWSMDNASLSLLEAALERERRTMKRQELLRRIWIAHRSSEHKSSEPSRAKRSKMLGPRPVVASS
jgi:DNA-binding response OmpR family regulator